MRVLVVDDDPAVRKLVLFLLADVAEVHECEDGAEALSAYEEHRPGWVLMDLNMRVVNGLVAAREIVVAHPEARVVIVTQHESPALRAAAAEAGACDYVLKDDLTELRRLITKDLSEA